MLENHKSSFLESSALLEYWPKLSWPGSSLKLGWYQSRMFFPVLFLQKPWTLTCHLNTGIMSYLCLSVHGACLLRTLNIFCGKLTKYASVFITMVILCSKKKEMKRPYCNTVCLFCQMIYINILKQKNWGDFTTVTYSLSGL